MGKSEKLEEAVTMAVLFTFGILAGFALVGLARIGVETIGKGVGTVKQGVQKARSFIKLNK